MPNVPSHGAALLEALAALPEDKREEALRDRGDVESLLVSLGDEAEKLVVVEVARARAAAELVVALADELGGPASRSRARRALGQALAYSGRFLEALDTCREASSIAEQGGAMVQAARARLASIHALGELGRFDDAVKAGETARAMLIEAGEPALAARADLNLGVIWRKRDQPARAVEHFRRALAPLQNEPAILAQLESNLGEALLDLNDLDGSEEAFGAALASFERAGHRWGAAIVEGNLADLATRQGRFDRALYHFESARRRIEQDKSPTHLARLLVEQADAKAAIGMLDEAATDYEAAMVRLADHGQRLDCARAMGGLARVQIRLGRRREAESHLVRACEELAALSQSTARAKIDLLQSELALDRGDAESARRLADRSLTELASRPLDAALARFHLARIGVAQGDFDGAERHVAEALFVAQAADIPPLVSDLLGVRGDVRAARGLRIEALSDLRSAVEQQERVRGTLQADRFRAACLGSRVEIYERLAAMLVASGTSPDIEEAFTVVEQAKSRSLLDLVRGVIDVAGTTGPGAAPGDAALVERLSVAQRRLNNLYRRIDDGIGVAAETWRTDVHALEIEIREIESRLAATRGVAQFYGAPAPLQEIRNCLETGETLIEYASLRGRIGVFVITPGAPMAFVWLAASSQLTDLCRRFHFQIGRALRPGALAGDRSARLTRDANVVASDLYDTLLRPIDGLLAGARRLIVVGHGPLHSIPFAALFDGRQHLIERLEVCSLPSASLFTHLREREGLAAATARALVVGVADQRAPRIAEEARRVAQLLPGSTLLIDEQATVDAVLERAAEAPIVHLAAHGRFDGHNPLSSGIRLSDRWLTVRDIYRMGINGAFVALSGCETGLGDVQAGDESIGLVRAFLAAGARTLAVSLWLVDDQAAAGLMDGFYERLRQDCLHGSCAAAMRGSQRALLCRQPHPAIWASFALVGLP